MIKAGIAANEPDLYPHQRFQEVTCSPVVRGLYAAGSGNLPLVLAGPDPAALDAGVDARIFEHLAQGPDHPVALDFPESAYL